MTGASKGTPPLRKLSRGQPCSVSEFAAKYRLDEQEAKRLYDKFGPSATELDILMAAKHHLPVTSPKLGG